MLEFIWHPIKYFRLRSKTPWFELNTEGKVVDGLVQLDMDWNTAFINQLREMGFSGHTEEEIVQSYLAALTQKQEDPFLTDGTPEPISSNHPKLTDGHSFRT